MGLRHMVYFRGVKSCIAQETSTRRVIIKTNNCNFDKKNLKVSEVVHEWGATRVRKGKEFVIPSMQQRYYISHNGSRFKLSPIGGRMAE